MDNFNPKNDIFGHVDEFPTFTDEELALLTECVAIGNSDNQVLKEMGPTNYSQFGRSNCHNTISNTFQVSSW
jgi:hypothetical protein